MLEFQASKPRPETSPSADEGSEALKPKLEPERESKVEAWAKEADALAAAHPGAVAIQLRDQSRMELRADGSRVRQVRALYRVEKDVGLRLASWGTSFEPDRERVRLLRVRTIRPDGTVLPVDPKKVRVQNASSSASNLTNRKTMLWQLDGVEVGTFVEHLYEQETFRPFRKDFFFPKWFFQGSYPVGKSELVVEVPEDKTLSYITRDFEGFQSQTEETTEAGKKIYRFTLSQVPPLVPEPAMPGSGEVSPRVHASLFPEWEPFFEWEGENLSANIEPTPKIRAKAQEIIQGLEDDEDRVAAIYRFLQREIRYVSIKSGIGSGWAGHPAEETLSNGYGDCVDKSVLFCSLLKTLDIPAEPIILMTSSSRDMETAVPGFDANHCITQIHLPGKSFYLDATTSHYRYPYFRNDDHAQPGCNPIQRKLVRVDLPPPSDNLAETRYEMRLDARGNLSGTQTWRGTGSQEASTRGFFKSIRPEDTLKVFQRMFSQISPKAKARDPKIENLEDLAQPFGFEASFEAPDFAVEAGPLWILELPQFLASFSEVTRPERSYPIDYRTSSKTVRIWTLEFPSGWKIRARPRDFFVSTEVGSISQSSNLRDGVLTIQRVSVRDRVEVPPERYASHRKALKEVEAATQERLFLEVAR